MEKQCTMCCCGPGRRVDTSEPWTMVVPGTEWGFTHPGPAISAITWSLLHVATGQRKVTRQPWKTSPWFTQTQDQGLVNYHRHDFQFHKWPQGSTSHQPFPTLTPPTHTHSFHFHCHFLSHEWQGKSQKTHLSLFSNCSSCKSPLSVKLNYTTFKVPSGRVLRSCAWHRQWMYSWVKHIFWASLCPLLRETRFHQPHRLGPISGPRGLHKHKSTLSKVAHLWPAFLGQYLWQDSKHISFLCL